MTIQELINELEKIEDRTLQVLAYNPYINEYSEVEEIEVRTLGVYIQT